MFRDRTRLNITAVLEGPFYEDTSMDFSGLPTVWCTMLHYFHVLCSCANVCEDYQHNASILQAEYPTFENSPLRLPVHSPGRVHY